jgi:hypothetical protein
MSKKDLTGMFRMLVHPDVSDSDYDSDEENEDIFKLKPKKERSGAYLLSSSESDNEDQETDAKLGNMSIEVTISKVCQSNQSNQTIIYTLAGTPLLLITDATQLASLQRLVLYILPFLPFHHYPPTHLNNPSKHHSTCVKC